MGTGAKKICKVRHEHVIVEILVPVKRKLPLKPTCVSQVPAPDPDAAVRLERPPRGAGPGVQGVTQGPGLSRHFPRGCSHEDSKGALR